MSSATLLRDLVHIPESVQKSDFVIKLSSGIDDPDRILRDYVVTADIAASFDQALSLITSALVDGQSKGAYLHGSFGSGKSHFMAVLHLLLRGNADARAKDELAPVVAKYDARLEGKKILLVPYHMVGKESMEAGVLGGYVEHVRKLHPDAALPPVFANEKIFDSARRLRDRLGDEEFFEGLGSAADGLSDLGDLVTGWDAGSFERAMNAAPDDEDRRRLTADLLETHFEVYADLAEGAGEGYVPLREGLSAMSRHAKGLGYHAVLLFLDELILWLGSRIADREFIAREVPKLSLLVEGAGPRPAPIVSLVARQRDLKDFVGDGVAGVDRAGLDHGLDYQSGRFGTITLADANLPAIVEQRLLRPTSASAKKTLDDAFEQFTQRADRSLETLMTDEADKEAFRRAYPFSPALIQVLVGVSAFLQRQRTGLRLLSELLVDRRDELTIGQIVPLGDLWDVVDRGEEPLDGTLKQHFDKARRLYRTKLRPVILDEYGVTEEQAAELPETHALRADDRLAKTLLLAALVPETPAVRGLTAGRLADLNHGSIRTPIPGGERARVLATLQKWAGRIGELRLDGDEQDPSVSLQLVGVDVDAILEKVANVDRPGARTRLVRDLLGEAIDVDVSGTVTPSVRHVWRGRKRITDLVFGNIRDKAEVPDSEFASSPQQPKLIIDHPFDDDSDFGPADDRARIDELRRKYEDDGRPLPPTACWIPRTLTARAKEDLGRLVLIEHVLTGDRLDKNTQDLPQKQRLEAKQQLSALRDQLRSSLRQVLRQAYGIIEADTSLVDDTTDLEDMFVAVDPGIELRPPTSPSFVDAFGEILDQLWSGIAPAHPEFPGEIRKRDLTRALELVQEAAAHPERRIDVAPGDRPLLQGVIAPLGLGDVGEAHFKLGRWWREHFEKERARDGKPPRTVEHLREWTDRPERRLLDDEVLALVVSTYAVEYDLAIEIGGAALGPATDKLPARAELVEVDLPDEAAWERAREIAEAVFGVQASRVLSAGNVASLAGQIREAVAAHRASATRLVELLDTLATHIDLPEDANRRRTARTVQRLLTDLGSTDDGLGLVDVLAAVEPPTSAIAMGTSMRQAEQVVQSIEDLNVSLLGIAFTTGGDLAGEARAIRERLERDAAHDQHAVKLEQTLREVEQDATDLVGRARRAEEPDVTAGAEHEAPGLVSQARTGLSTADARALIDELAARDVENVEIRWQEPSS